MKLFGIDLFKHEYLHIGIAYERSGNPAKGEDYIRKFKDFADHDLTMYKDLHLTAYYSHTGELDKAAELLTRFANERDDFLYWLLLMPADPAFDELKKHPAFEPAMKTIERKFWKKHDEMKERWGSEFADL
jgi:hypothetical protein